MRHLPSTKKGIINYGNQALAQVDDNSDSLQFRTAFNTEFVACFVLITAFGAEAWSRRFGGLWWGALCRRFRRLRRF